MPWVNIMTRTTKNFGIVYNKIIRNPDIPAPVKALYAVLATYRSSTENTCYPTNATLAEHLSVTERSITNWLDVLEKHGVISRVMDPDSRRIIRFTEGEG